MRGSIQRFKCAASILCLAAFPAHAQQATTYTYDALGRLGGVQQTGGPVAGTSVTYTYDAAGNRQTYVSTNPSGFSVAAASANEGSPLSFTVTRGSTSGAATVSYATSNGTALAGTNYTATTGVLSFASGVSSAVFTVPTIDDGVVTSNLNLSVTLTNPSVGSSLSSPMATGTIVNIDTAPSLSIASATANEGSPLTFTVTRSGNSSNAATVNYATSNGTAVAGTNYTATSGTLSFAAGATSQSFTVPTVDDHVYAANLTMTATLSAPSSGAVLGMASATGTIANTDAQPSLSIAGASANEGSPLTFTVTRSGATGNSVTASYATANGTAVAGTNYTATSGTVSFAAGVTTQAITVPTINDNVNTANLTMTTALASPTGGAVIGTSSATGTVINTNTGWSSALVAGSYTNCTRGGCIVYVGYLSTPTTGSMSVTTINGFTISALASIKPPSEAWVYISETGPSAPPNSGWVSIVIPGVGTLQRSAATYTASGSTATWTWASSAIPTSGTVIIQ